MVRCHSDTLPLVYNMDPLSYVLLSPFLNYAHIHKYSTRALACEPKLNMFSVCVCFVVCILNIFCTWPSKWQPNGVFSLHWNNSLCFECLSNVAALYVRTTNAIIYNLQSYLALFLMWMVCITWWNLPILSLIPEQR